MGQNHAISVGIEGEAWLHLLRVDKKLAELEKLATQDSFQQFVWELNDFVSSARKVTNYLLREPGRPPGFKAYVKNEMKSLRAIPRNKYFYDLRNISDKVCAVAPSSAAYGTSIVESIVLQDGVETELRDSKTGEIMAHVRLGVTGLSEEERTLTITKGYVKYFLAGWPDEDVLTFLDSIVDTLRKLMYAAYEAYPNTFQLHRVTQIGQERPSRARLPRSNVRGY
jgi:hypothetical protein